MKKQVTVICLILLLTVGVLAREKQEKIGKYSWYTEENTMEEVIQIAKNTGKPILAVFSATWCGPCQHVKKTVFKTDEFKKVAGEVVLLYIEETTKKGKEYNKKFKIRGWPTFKLFSKEGVMLETGNPKRTVEGFLEWINDVKGGNNYYQLSQKLEKEPNNREALVKITGKMGYSKRKEKIEYLRKAIKLKPDFNDPLAQEAYESLAMLLVSGIPRRNEDKTKEYVAENGALFDSIIDAYYPAKVKHGLKGTYGSGQVINWYSQSGNFNKALSYFDAFVKSKNGTLDLVKDTFVVYAVIPAYLGLNRTDDARAWAKKIYDRAKSEEKIEDSRGFVYYSSYIYEAIIKHYAGKNNISEAETYAGQLYEILTKLDQERLKSFRMQEYAAKYGILTDQTLRQMDEKLKTAKGSMKLMLVTGKAKVLAKIDKKKEAANLLKDLYNDNAFFDGLKADRKSEILNAIAWTMVEIEMVDQTCLEIAKKAVELDDNGLIMDTLACVHAKLGNYKEAVEIERKALAKVDHPAQKKELGDKIKEWEKKLK